LKGIRAFRTSIGRYPGFVEYPEPMGSCTGSTGKNRTLMQHLHTSLYITLRHLLLIASSALGLAVNATNYYVSETGNDANSGTSQAQAWRTIGRVNQVIYGLQPGDQILFKRGGTYRGTLIIGSSGTSGSPIAVGAYGTGNNPVLSGSTALSGWSLHQGNIWKVALANAPEHVFCAGALMTLARYPNSGWLRNDQGAGTYINDADLTQPAGHWNGAELVVRSQNWSYDVTTVTDHTTGHLEFNNIYFNLDTLHWGYYLQNKLSELDAQKEWYHDAVNGWLYFRAPGNADPNTIPVAASTVDQGLWIQPNRHHITISGITFREYHDRAIYLETADHITIQNCTFEDLGQAIYSYGHHNAFQNNLVQRTYKTGLRMIDNNTTISGNQFEEVAMQPGLGESNWGYMGVRISGNNNVVRENRLHTIGYIGISVESNTLVERNFVQNALALLNDGCGIGMDNSNGMIIRDNIVVDIVGNLESCAPNGGEYWNIAFGIYTGNLSVQNTLIERNTVGNCSGGGMHVDHTMLSGGNEFRDNVLFNNAQQISFSDFSNYNGPGAVAPYSVPAYTATITGNVFHSVRADQLCMRQLQVWTPGGCDFGTFTNNHFINPYNDQSIYVEDLYDLQWKRFTLARYQAERNDELGSTTGPLRFDDYAVTSVLSQNLVANGTFDNNVNGWGGWPSNAQVTQDYTFLDNGALKANLPNANVYPSFTLRNPDPLSIQNGEWYRLKFSIQSNAHGEVRVGIKGDSQISGPQMIHGGYIPFDGTRRDVTMIFQSGLTDQARVQLTNNFTEPTYWLDNVQLERVVAEPIDPLEQNKLIYNDQLTSQTFPIDGCWRDVNGNLVSGSVTLAPFASITLLKEEDILCGLSTSVEEDNASSNNENPALLHPNPVSNAGEVFLSHAPASDIRIEVLDVQGRVVRTERLRAGQRSFQLDGTLKAGIYTLAVVQGASPWQARLVVL
jgi:hypothetical protein